jgi:RNA polymerase sigma-70 factor, ECF subfamily
VDAFTSMLAEEASFAMPPLASWYRGREAIARWAADWSLSGAWRWRALPTSACGQPALGFYAWSEQDGVFTPFALNVLSLEGERVSDVTAFIARAPEVSTPEAYGRYPEEPPKPELVAAFFGRFGLPEQLRR